MEGVGAGCPSYGGRGTAAVLSDASMSMGIDPKILAQLERAKQAPQDDGVDAELPGMPAATPNGAGALPMLRGSEKQIKWATTIRETVLGFEWTPNLEAVLRTVVDSTWWIANRAMIQTMKFKPPSLNQTTSSVLPVIAPPPVLDYAVRMTQVAQEGVNRKRLDDAFAWAHSVAQDPRLAEAAIVAMLYRQYKDPDMRLRLRRKGDELLELAETGVAKDVDAIRRMLFSAE
jgi:hypothetical protein